MAGTGMGATAFDDASQFLSLQKAWWPWEKPDGGPSFHQLLRPCYPHLLPQKPPATSLLPQACGFQVLQLLDFSLEEEKSFSSHLPQSPLPCVPVPPLAVLRMFFGPRELRVSSLCSSCLCARFLHIENKAWVSPLDWRPPKGRAGSHPPSHYCLNWALVLSGRLHTPPLWPSSRAEWSEPVQAASWRQLEGALGLERGQYGDTQGRAAGWQAKESEVGFSQMACNPDHLGIPKALRSQLSLPTFLSGG